VVRQCGLAWAPPSAGDTGLKALAETIATERALKIRQRAALVAPNRIHSLASPSSMASILVEVENTLGLPNERKAISTASFMRTSGER
jgi:hypothetical protein